MNGLNLGGLMGANSNQQPTAGISSLNLSKGMSLDLSKKSNLKRVRLGLGWEAGDGQNFDLDASALLLNTRGLVNDPQDVIFYNQPDTSRGVMSMGDNRVGSNQNVGDEDDETIMVELDRVPANVDSILFIVTIHEAQARRQNFGMVKNAYIRVIDEDTQNEECRYKLAENFSMQTACEIAKLQRTANGWEFIALGKGTTEDLTQVLIRHGVR